MNHQANSNKATYLTSEIASFNPHPGLRPPDGPAHTDINIEQNLDSVESKRPVRHDLKSPDKNRPRRGSTKYKNTPKYLNKRFYGIGRDYKYRKCPFPAQKKNKENSEKFEKYKDSEGEQGPGGDKKQPEISKIVVPYSDKYNIVFPFDEQFFEYSKENFHPSYIQHRLTNQEIDRLLIQLNQITLEMTNKLQPQKTYFLILFFILIIVTFIAAVLFLMTDAGLSSKLVILIIALVFLFLVFSGFGHYYKIQLSTLSMAALSKFQTVISYENKLLKEKELEWKMGDLGFWVTLRLVYEYKKHPPAPAAGFAGFDNGVTFPPPISGPALFDSLGPDFGEVSPRMQKGGTQKPKDAENGLGGRVERRQVKLYTPQPVAQKRFNQRDKKKRGF